MTTIAPMALLNKQVFVCLDCETTGTDIYNDRVIEFSAVRFSLEGGEIKSFDTLINPGIAIPKVSSDVHHISDEMVAVSPSIAAVFDRIVKFVGDDIIVGHNINFDIGIINAEAERLGPGAKTLSNRVIDTLRLAHRYSGGPLSNTLESLVQYFNVEEQGAAHRAMADVKANVEVFRHLTVEFNAVEELMTILAQPILMKRCPLKKYKGQPFENISVRYLYWAISSGLFSGDLLFSLKNELKICSLPEQIKNQRALAYLSGVKPIRKPKGASY